MGEEEMIFRIHLQRARTSRLAWLLACNTVNLRSRVKETEAGGSLNCYLAFLVRREGV
jgi:hypothetical protein